MNPEVFLLAAEIIGSEVYGCGSCAAISDAMEKLYLNDGACCYTTEYHHFLHKVFFGPNVKLEKEIYPIYSTEWGNYFGNNFTVEQREPRIFALLFCWARLECGEKE